MKKITIKGLADFMASGPAAQRKIVRNYKYPDEDEAFAKTIYYREARDRIEIFHRHGHAGAWLLQESNYLDGLATQATGRSKTRLGHNARTLRDYARHFSATHLDLLERPKLQIVYGDVLVSGRPDLYGKNSNLPRLIKLEFGVDAPSQTEVKVISQFMFEAAAAASRDARAKPAMRPRRCRGARPGRLDQSGFGGCTRTRFPPTAT